MEYIRKHGGCPKLQQAELLPSNHPAALIIHTLMMLYSPDPWTLSYSIPPSEILSLCSRFGIKDEREILEKCALVFCELSKLRNQSREVKRTPWQQ